jgi:hypothetical protein
VNCKTDKAVIMKFGICISWLLLMPAVMCASRAECRYLVFARHGQPVAVERSREQLESFVPGAMPESDRDRLVLSVFHAWAAGPADSEHGRGIRHWLPIAGADAVDIRNGNLTIFVTLPCGFLTDQLTWERNDAVLRAVSAMVMPEMSITGIGVMARPAESGCPAGYGYKPLDSWIDPGEPPPPKPYENTGLQQADVSGGTYGRWPGQPGAPGQGMYSGSLAGKSIFISQSHGWYSNGSYWLTQRPNTNDIVEDFINAEAVNQYLVYYLYNAGAGVYTCRERDMHTVMQVIDNTDSAYTDAGSWSDSTSTPGYYGSNYRTHPVTSSGHGYAAWTVTPDTAGYYEVYAWYTGGSNRAVDARYTVGHSGGETVVIQNQQRDGYTWKSLGRYAFDPADPPDKRRVTLSTEGSTPGQYVIADAVRIGGGMGSIPDPVVSGRPRWEESGRYFAEFMGCDTCGTSTVTAMPRYAAWENEAWEDSVYISWHTNAPDPGTGTSTYIHNTAAYPLSDILRDRIHDEIINDIRAGYDATWTDRGKLSANFGEINSANNNEMPAMLIELAFHDTPADALYLKDPKFRMLAARAIYQGVEKYYASKDSRPVHLLPEPPETFCARNMSGSMVHLAWSPPPHNTGDDLLGDPAEGYRVYVSETGSGFSDGISVTGTSLVLGPYPPGSVRCFRVTATNTGGESFPSPTLAVKIPESGQPVNLLLVHAFDRLDRFALVPQYESGPLGTDLRMFLDRMNTFDYTVSHARAAAGFPGGFDSCVSDAVDDGTVILDMYPAVDWIAGEESTVDETFSSGARAAVTAYLDAGGNLFASGAELTWDLDLYGSGEERYFCHHYLKAAYGVDDAGSDSLTAVSGGVFDGLDDSLFDYDLFEIYAVEYPDGLIPVEGSGSVLMYSGTAHTAAVAYDGDFRVITMGVPLESILSETDRAAVMNRVLEFLIPIEPCENTGDVDGSGTITAADAQMAFLIALGVIQPTQEQACAADCNGNGIVTAEDAQTIFLVVLGQVPACADPVRARSLAVSLPGAARW